MNADKLVEAMARAIAVADACDGMLPVLLESESYMAKAMDLATAAYSALREKLVREFALILLANEGGSSEWLEGLEFAKTRVLSILPEPTHGRD